MSNPEALEAEIRSIIKSPMRSGVSTSDIAVGMMSSTSLSEKIHDIAALIARERQDAYNKGWRNAHKDMHDSIDWGQRSMADPECKEQQPDTRKDVI